MSSVVTLQAIQTTVVLYRKLHWNVDECFCGIIYPWLALASYTSQITAQVQCCFLSFLQTYTLHPLHQPNFRQRHRAGRLYSTQGRKCFMCFLFSVLSLKWNVFNPHLHVLRRFWWSTVRLWVPTRSILTTESSSDPSAGFTRRTPSTRSLTCPSGSERECASAGVLPSYRSSWVCVGCVHFSMPSDLDFKCEESWLIIYVVYFLTDSAWLWDCGHRSWASSSVAFWDTGSQSRASSGFYPQMR